MDTRNVQKPLLAPGDFPLGRDLSYRLARLLPYVTTGRAGPGVRRLVRREHLEWMLERALAERVDLWDLARRFEGDPDGFRRWLEADARVAA